MNTFNKLKYITNFCSFATLASSISFAAHADLPLLVEDLVTNKNRFKLEVKLNYINQTTSQLSDPSFTLVTLGDGSTLAFPNPTLQGEYNSDTALINLGLRYGIKDNTELGIKINTITTQHRQQISGSSKTTSHAPQAASQVMQTTQPMSALELGYAFELDSQHLQLASMNTQEMTETEGAALPLLAVVTSSAVSSWAYHGINYLKTGHIGTSSGAAWAAGAGALGALHGSSLAIHTGLQGWQKAGMSLHGLGVSSSLNFVNPWR